MSRTSPKKSKIKQQALVGLMTAVICVLSPFALHLPISPVPISLGTLAVYFTVFVLGMKLGTASVLIYILLGLAGLPVFTGFTAGPGTLLGPTGGYIVGYLFITLICGYFIDKFPKKVWLCALSMALSTAVCYLFGTLWLARLLDLSFTKALWAGVIPYIPGDILKLALAVSIGFQIKKRLHKAGLSQKGEPTRR